MLATPSSWADSRARGARHGRRGGDLPGSRGRRGIILLSEQHVAERLAGDVTVAIHVPNTVTGITAEVLTIIVTTDALAQAVAAAHTEYTLESAHTLETLRQQLGF